MTRVQLSLRLLDESLSETQSPDDFMALEILISPRSRKYLDEIFVGCFLRDKTYAGFFSQVFKRFFDCFLGCACCVNGKK